MNEPSLDLIHDVLYGASKALVLKFAIDLDVFTAITQGNQSAAEVAAYADCNEDGVCALLDALVPLGFLRKRNGNYELTSTSSAFLVKNRPTYYGDSYLDAILPWAWRDSSESVTTLRNPGGAGKEITDVAAVALWKPWCEARALTWRNDVGKAKRMWAVIREQVSILPGPCVLDLACGDGLSTLVLAQEYPDATITAIDRYPEVLEVTLRLAGEMGILERVRTQVSDIHDVTFESRAYDVVYIGGILYLFSECQIADILARVEKCVRPGGLLVVNTMIADPDRCKALGPLIQSFRRFLYSGGRVPTFDEYRNLFEAAGFRDTTQIEESLLIAHTPVQ